MRHVQMCYVPWDVTMSYVSVDGLVIMRDRFIRVRCIPMRVFRCAMFSWGVSIWAYRREEVIVHVRCVPVRPVLIWESSWG